MQTNIFSYDPLDRLTNSLTAFSTSVEQTYQLDGSGNRMTVISNGVAQPYLRDNTPPPGPADFQVDQYTSTPFGVQTYDEIGNLIGRFSAIAQTQFQFDYASRLVAVLDLSSGAPSPVATFTYDASGRRISKTTYPPVPALPVTTEYIQRIGGETLWHGDDTIEERVGGTLAASFILDGTRSHDDEVVKTFAWTQVSGPFKFSTSSGELLMQRGGQNYFLHSDEMGNVLALTDGSGNAVEHYNYGDYGGPAFLTSDGVPMGTNASPAGNPFLFHGMKWDGETELYWGHSQGGTTGPMDPKTGRFIDGRYVLRAGVPLRFEAAGSFAGDNPWSLKKEEGGRHTPFHNKYRPQFSASAQSRDYLKDKFMNGDIPDQNDFQDLIDSALNLHDDGLTHYSSPGGKIQRAILKSFFETGSVPTSGRFIQATTSAVRTVILVHP